jgi:very-long-chain enoyl-CoA reductase
MELKVINQTKGKKEKNEEITVICNYSDLVRDLKSVISSQLNISLTPSRLGLSLIDSNDSNNRISLSNDYRTLRDYEVNQGMTIVVKDLGPQIGYRTTYIVEYLGPFFIIFYFFFFYLGPDKANNIQILGFIMSSFHFGKRILESAFIHDFSNSTMPLMNLFKNCAHYWLLYGLICGYSLFNPGYKQPGHNIFWVVVLAFLFFSAEIKNLRCHLILKDLKEKNKGEKGIPDGEGFELVSCANYFWEFLAWIFFSILVNTIPFYIFTVIGFYQMTLWALKKHRNYLKTFPDRYPKNRKAIIPFLL